ncbi:MAG TPA: hypothetical protein VMU16_02965, partial [Candidatus Binataceae bacterium]|nr:hypothetical protein [Candidatus Binataceae bacterium]
VGLGPRFVLPQHPDDLLLAESTPSHCPSPYLATDSTSSWWSFRGAGHSFYALYSGLALISAAGMIFAPLVHRLLHRFHVDEKRR